MASEEETVPPTKGTEDKEQIDPKTEMPPPPPKTAADMEKEQEVKLRSRYPGLKGPGSSAFLQKRLSKGQKYFDSGDYNMAKAKLGPSAVAKLPKSGLPQHLQKPITPTGPAPINAGGNILIPGDATLTGDEHPTPESLTTRKPSVVSKLAAGLI